MLDDEEMKKEVLRIMRIMASPNDFEKWIAEGHIQKLGRSYYLTATRKELPDYISKKIRSIAESKNGLRVTFASPSLRLKKLNHMIPSQSRTRLNLDYVGAQDLLWCS